MLVTNSIIVSVIAAVLSSQDPWLASMLFLAVVGLLLCWVWIRLVARGFVHHRYWGERTNDLEGRIFDGEVTTTRGLKELEFDRLSDWSQRKSAYSMIAAFLILYGAGIAYSLAAIFETVWGGVGAVLVLLFVVAWFGRQYRGWNWRKLLRG